MLKERFGVSERHACQVVGQPRSTQRLPAPVPSEDEEHLRAFLRNFSVTRPRWGWRRAADAARDAGWRVNDKRIHRLWRDEGLRVPYKKRKKTPPGHRRPDRGDVPDQAERRLGARLPVRPDRRREDHQDPERHRRVHPGGLTIEVDRSIDADHVVTCLDKIAGERGYPVYLRFDNGPEFVAYAVADWCRFNDAGTIFIDPGSPWQNAWIESFNGRIRDEHLNGQLFDTLFEAQVLTEDWRIDYNINRPHSGHGWKTPAAFAEAWNTTNQQQLA